ncbi:MAG: PAS domain-containing protein, partial [Candidatus Edwardsbacteria bacterium]|nr:PAS domain-containing protein [Candidatus Edwardsbacteria bacterium]
IAAQVLSVIRALPAFLFRGKGRLVELDRKATVMVMRWLVVLLVLFMAAYSAKGLDFDSPNFLLAYGYVVANVLISLVSVRLFDKTWFTYLLFIADIVFVSAVIYFSEGVNTDFYLIYFLSIFMSSVSRSVGGAAPVAVISSVLYGWLIFQKSGAEMFAQPSFWIRIPFFFLIALFSSFWSSQVASEKRQKEEIERFSQRLRLEVEAATEEILKSHENFKTLKEYNDNILASISSGVIVVDLNGAVTTFNREAVNVFKIVSGAVVGKNLDQFEKMKPIADLLRRTMKTGRQIYRRELTVAADDGRECVIGISTSILHSQTARTNGAIAVFTDLSKTKSRSSTRRSWPSWARWRR